MKQNLFELPRPYLVKEAKQRNQNQNMARDGKDLKVRGQTLIARPEFSNHVCVHESNCTICKYYINKLDEFRSK